MLIPSVWGSYDTIFTSLSRRVNANSQQASSKPSIVVKLIKKGEC